MEYKHQKTVSVIIPTFNEEAYIEATLGSILKTDYPKKLIEIIVVDGNSSDATVELVTAMQKSHSDVDIKLLNNPKRKQVYGLNLAIHQSRGEILIRCDAHSCYPVSYISTLVNAHREDNRIKINVGISYLTETQRQGMWGDIIKSSMSSKVAIGVSHRSMELKEKATVDTLLFGCWKRGVFDEVGLFDENFIRGQDSEHNYRIINEGGQVILVPSPDRFTYFARDSVIKIYRMLFQYASVKVLLFKKYRRVTSLRAFIPAMFFVCLPILGWINPVLGMSIFACYFFVVIAAGVLTMKGLLKGTLFGLTVVGMHLSHALGFLHGLYSYILLSKEKLNYEATR